MITKEIGGCLEFDLKSISNDGWFTGYGSVFNVKDLGGDIVQPGAFTKSLQSKPASSVKMFEESQFSTSSTRFGVWSSITEDAQRGLKATGRLILDTVKGREILRFAQSRRFGWAFDWI